jgi:hypothetical protein
VGPHEILSTFLLGDDDFVYLRCASGCPQMGKQQFVQRALMECLNEDAYDIGILMRVALEEAREEMAGRTRAA